LDATTIRLETYAKQPQSVLVSLNVQVVYEHQPVTSPLVIVEGNGPTLFGRYWFNAIKLNWAITPELQVCMIFAQIRGVVSAWFG